MQDDFANAAKQIDTAIEMSTKAGKPVTEQWLQLALSSYAELDDDAGIKKSLEQLLRQYPSPKYWDQMFTILQNRRDSDGRTTMNLYRLMFDAGQLKRPDDYTELAQYTFEAGIPASPLKVLKQGFDKNLLGGKDEQRRKPAPGGRAKQAASDQKSPAGSLKREAIALPETGVRADAVLGIAHAELRPVTTRLSRPYSAWIAEGRGQAPEEAQLMLGRALAQGESQCRRR